MLPDYKAAWDGGYAAARDELFARTDLTQQQKLAAVASLWAIWVAKVGQRGSDA